MPELFCTKVKTQTGSALMPSHATDQAELDKFPVGQPLKCKITRMRNVGHHRKYMALLNYVFNLWEPVEGEVQIGFRVPIKPEKNFDTFRKNVAVLAGFHELHYTIKGTIRTEARSISFDNMSQDDFEILYDLSLNVLLKLIQQLKGYTAEQLQEIVDQVMEFDS